jgi:lipopolysaccharide exporter
MSVSSSLRWSAVEAAGARLIGLIGLIVVARLLGPEALGIASMVAVAMEFSGLLAEFGLTAAIIHFQQASNRQIATLYTGAWLLGVGAFGAMFAAAPLVASAFGEPVVRDLLRTAALGFLIAPLASQVLALLQRAMRFRTLALCALASSSVGVVSTIGCALAGVGVWSLILGGLAAAVTSQSMLTWIGLREGLFRGFGLAWRETWPLLRFGAFLVGSNLLNLVNSRVDQVAIGAQLGAAPLGVWRTAAQGSVALMGQVNGIATRVALPAFARIQGDRPAVQRAYLRLVNRALTVNAAAMLGLAAVAEPLVDLLLGPTWAELVPVLQWMAAYAAVRGLGNVNGTLIVSLGRAQAAFLWNLGLLVILPAALLLLVASGSLVLVAAGLLALQMLITVAAYWVLVRRLIGPCGIDYLVEIVRSTVPAVLMFVVVQSLYGAAPGLGDLALLATLALTGALTLLLVSLVVNRAALVELMSLLSPLRGMTRGWRIH